MCSSARPAVPRSVNGEKQPVVTVSRGWFTTEIHINGVLATGAGATAFHWRRVVRAVRGKRGSCPECGASWGEEAALLAGSAALLCMAALAVAGALYAPRRRPIAGVVVWHR